MSTPPGTRTDTAALQAAFDALRRYDRGSARGDLLPIDDALVAATADAALRTDLEERLVSVLRGPAPAVAREYACARLAVIGGPVSVPALAALLADAALAHAATNALQAMPAPEAAAALRDALARLDGLPIVGVITALGMKRDTASVPLLADRIESTDRRVAVAATAALGEIGSAEAAAALKRLLAACPEGLRAVAGEACLVCAERLRSANRPAEARTLLDALEATTPARHVREALERHRN